jgi:Ca-activated chloride channel family protein
MTPDDFELKLTAYALNDPSLTDAERAEIETRLRDDAAARQLLEQTRQLGHLLTKSLAAEEQPAAASVAPAVAASLAKPRAVNRWAITLASLAAVVMLAVFANQQFAPRESRTERETAAKNAPEMSNTFNEETAPLAEGLELALGAPSATTMDELAAVTAVPADKRESFKRRGLGGGGFQGGGSPAQPGYLPPSNPTGATPGSATATDPAADDTTRYYEAKPAAPGENKPAKDFYAKAPAPPPPPLPSVKGEAELESRGGPLAISEPGRKQLSPNDPFGDTAPSRPSGNAYRQLIENPFTRVEGLNALSTFGVDVDTASYAIVRNYLSRNAIPHPDAVRIEEMVNYFPYRDAPPEGNDPFTVRVEMADCPWASKHRLARIALKAKAIDNAKRPPSNLVFLVDVSGSMDEPNKLPLVKASMKLLTEQLGENDRVAMVVYAGASGLVLDSTNASKKNDILKAIDNLSAGGSTNGASGIQLAYDVAVRNFIEKGTNRVILCTDGDWNVGTTGTDALVKLIEEKKKTGVFLSVFGFGMGNLRDEMMVQLAGKGNGNYGYIDTIAEAKKALVEQISGTLVTVAKDVKIQIEFNPAKVASYRLLGYEKRKLAAKDFHDDKKDAGEMGAGHVVTALYELVPVGVAATEAPKVDGLRYQPATPAPEKPKAEVNAKTATEAFVVKLRHKLPDADTSTLREIPVGDVAKSYDKASEDFQFASAVAAFGMLLKQSPYKGQASYALVEELAMSSMTHDPGAYRAEFLQLVKKAKALTGQK